uniref:site-specific integrase n=1 Tax=Agathobacter sp. TaxID=2021311 RepID=UPI004055B6C3
MEKKSVAFFERGSWYHRTKTLKEDGTVKYGKKGGFESEQDAVKAYKLAEKEFKQQQRKAVMTGKNRQEVMLKDYLIYWYEEVFSQRIKNTTKMIGAYVLYDLVFPNMEQDIKLRYVSVEYMDALLEKVSHSCASAGNTCRAYLNIAFKDAVIEGYIPRNPIPDTKAYKRKAPKVTIYSKEKLKIFLKAASKDEWYLEYLLGVFCGLRKGEILGLKFSDFDFEQHTVSVKRQLGANPVMEERSSKIASYSVIEKDPKTFNSVRTLRIPQVIETEVLRRKNKIDEDRAALMDGYEDNDYISCQPNGRPHNMSSMNIALTKLCNRNGLPKITVHSLRHMFATILIEQGVPLVKISALLGHSSVNTTFEYYCDVMDENENIINFLNEKYSA